MMKLSLLLEFSGKLLPAVEYLEIEKMESILKTADTFLNEDKCISDLLEIFESKNKLRCLPLPRRYFSSETNKLKSVGVGDVEIMDTSYSMIETHSSKIHVCLFILLIIVLRKLIILCKKISMPLR